MKLRRTFLRVQRVEVTAKLKKSSPIADTDIAEGYIDEAICECETQKEIIKYLRADFKDIRVAVWTDLAEAIETNGLS